MQEDLKKKQKNLRIEEALKSNLKKRKIYQSKMKIKNKK